MPQMGNVGVVRSQRQHSVPVPCGFRVLHHLLQQSDIAGYRLQSTYVLRFIYLGAWKLEHVGNAYSLLSENVQVSD